LTESHLFFILKTVLGRSLDPRLLGKFPDRRFFCQSIWRTRQWRVHWFRRRLRWKQKQKTGKTMHRKHVPDKLQP